MSAIAACPSLSSTRSDDQRISWLTLPLLTKFYLPYYRVYCHICLYAISIHTLALCPALPISFIHWVVEVPEGHVLH